MTKAQMLHELRNQEERTQKLYDRQRDSNDARYRKTSTELDMLGTMYALMDTYAWKCPEYVGTHGSDTLCAGE